MDERTEATAETMVLQHCVVCGIDKAGCTAVAVVERSSGPSRLLYACPGCMAYKNLLSLDEQTDTIGDGRLQFRKA